MGGLKYSNLFRESNFAIHVSSKTYFFKHCIDRIEIRGNKLPVICLARITNLNEWTGHQVEVNLTLILSTYHAR